MNSTTSTLASLHQRRQNGTSTTKSELDQRKGASTTSVRDVRKAVTKSVTWKWWLMAMAAFFIGAYATAYYFVESDLGGHYDLTARYRILSKNWGLVHIFGAAVAMLLGPLQFLQSLRRTGKPAQGPPMFSAHSWIGRVATLAAIASGVGSICIVWDCSKMNGWGHIGFALLGSSWIFSGVAGWRAMKKETPDIASHKKWMTRHFACTYAAVSLRWQLPMLMAFGIDDKLALSIQGYMCWIPNLIFVEALGLSK